MIKYQFADDIQKTAEEISRILFSHIRFCDVMCFRSYGSSSRRTIARCHALSKIIQKALGRKGFYVLEFLSERFDKLDVEEQIKIIIHELMHIPKTFGGGFKHHNFVTQKNVARFYEEYKKRKNDNKMQEECGC